jgi:hypothetical protein
VEVAMKRIKYIIITVLFLLTSSQAGYIYESYWPGHWVKEEEEELSLNQIPVRIEMPGFAQIINAKDLEIFLDDINTETYEGCTNFQVMCNLDITLGCKLIINGKVSGDYSCWIDDTYVQATGSTPETRTACVRLENPKYHYFAASEEGVVTEVAQLVLTVAPR